MKFYGLLWCALFSLTLTAQQQVKGYVLDSETDDPLIGAHVYLIQNWRIGAVTDDQGAFNLTVPSNAKDDSLIFSYLGYNEQVLPLKVNTVIKLVPKASVWEEVVVTAKPLIAEEFKYIELNKLDIYTNPAAKADPILAVNSLPAATTTDESANISLRGSSPLETGIFLNDIPVYDAVRYAQLNGIGTFSLFNTSIINKVTVFPGNPPLEYGNATSGIISLNTDVRIVKENVNSLLLSLASLGFNREQKISESQSLKLFTNYQPSGVMKALNEKSLNEIKSFESADLGIYWYGALGQFQWKVLNYGLLEGYKFKFQHPSFQGIFNQSKKRWFTNASMERSTNKTTVALNVGRSNSLGDFDYSNVDFEVKNRDFFAGLNYSLKSLNFQLKTGVSYDHRYSKVEGTFHRISYALNTNHPTDSLDQEINSKSLESFLYMKYFLTDALTVGAGLRKNIPIGIQKSYWSRQVNLSYNHEPWNITIGVGKYHKYGLEENNGGILQVSSNQMTLDVKFNQTNWSATASVFSKTSTINEDTYDIIGLELYANYKISGNLSGSLSFTGLDASNKDGQPYPYDLSYFIKGNLSYSPTALWTIESIFTAREGVQYFPVSGANFDSDLQVFEPIFASTSTRRSSYFALGLSLSRRFTLSDNIGLIAFASVNNLTNHENVRGTNYSFNYQSSTLSLFAQRTGYVGVLVNF